MPTEAQPATPSWDDLDHWKYADETEAAQALLAASPLDPPARAAVEVRARDIVLKARALRRRKGVMESFLEEFGLSNSEGLALMCLAEALLRIPDEATADKLIAEKIKSGNWSEHLGRADSWLVNAGAFGLMLTGRVVSLGADVRNDPGGFLGRLVNRAGEPVIRAAMMQAMRILGEQFVLGRTIEAALKRGKAMIRAEDAASYSFDMLGEGARTRADAARYFKSYADAIAEVGAHETGKGPEVASGVSVKLSALHPRFEARQAEMVHRELYPQVLELARAAARHDIHLTLDAEEADRLLITLELFERLAREPELKPWRGLGLAVQAYQKRSLHVVERLIGVARSAQRKVFLRLVKGAYWDGEIKRAQMQGRPDFPVWTTKQATDASYLACAGVLLNAPDAVYPAFATHNAHTAAAIARIADARGARFEFQRLHGMGEALYRAAGFKAGVRVYAPVGGHEDLLPYLVRRLLENGANTSFVHSFLDDDVSPDLVAADPLARLEGGPKRHPRLPPPPLLFGASRRNSGARDLSIAADRDRFVQEIAAQNSAVPILVTPLIDAAAAAGENNAALRNPTHPSQVFGAVMTAKTDEIGRAIASAAAAQPDWDGRGGVARAAVLRNAADLLDAAHDRFVALIAREAGRTLQDGVDEVREAVDFLRYYAAEAERHFGAAVRLPGPAGETNHLELRGRGVFACISPWNFPLAIFLGQIAAALAAGNSVIAKPAEQTPLIGFEAVRLMHQAGIPAAALQFLPGDGAVGAAIVADPRIAGVAFTGSTEVAQKINRTLAARDGPIAVLIAETGGLNAMFVDTTALKEQVVDDAIVSAFGSAGQRCSALRLILLPHDTADATIETLAGAMQALVLGDPADPRTDIGPVIDADAKAMLEAHLSAIGKVAKVHAQCAAPDLSGHFFGPALIELSDLGQLNKEVFGPILHVLRYDPAEIEMVGAALAAKGYGLTLGVHSRLESFAQAVRTAVPAGNTYVNRSMIGAVVGVQPFGGRGLSGTGPKAGGPHYLMRFADERTITINVAAQGGDPALLNL
jgi:RHH-type transcriptional regulator, proline utilization regulon repressor / proline dehydrogenase / delta 1-pyrroline-5-carboxylate dehydrogenase